MSKPKLIRITTVPVSLKILLKGQCKFMNQYFEVIGVSSPGEKLLDVEKNEGIRVIPIEMIRKIAILKDLRALFQLYFLFKKEKPLIVHSITPKAGLLSMMAAKLAGVPIRIHTFSGLIFPFKTGLLKKILIKTDQLLCSCATNIYPEGMGVKQDLINYKITSKPLKIIGNGNVNGIDTEYFNPELFTEEQKNKFKKELNIAPHDFVFIFVGRLVSDKGINELVKVFDKMSQEYKNIKLILVGSLEPDLDPLKKETLLTINKNPGIIAVGFQADVRPYFAISQALVFPSHREGFPNVVMQAGAMGLPSIVTNINGCNEIVTEGKNGVIIPVKDEEAIFTKMEEFLKNESLSSQLGKDARRIIICRFDQQKLWKEILYEYKSIQGEPITPTDSYPIILDKVEQ